MWLEQKVLSSEWYTSDAMAYRDGAHISMMTLFVIIC